MTELQAWKYLAKKWDGAKRQQVLFGDIEWAVRISHRTCQGLCYCISVLNIGGVISPETADIMERKASLGRKWEYSFRWPLTMKGAKSRAAFCRKQVKLLTKKKGRKK